MPVTVTKEVRPVDTRPDDILVSVAGQNIRQLPAPIWEREIKRTNVLFTIPLRKSPIRVSRDEGMVTIQREEETEEERNTRRAAEKIEDIKHAIERVNSHLARARERVHNTITNGGMLDTSTVAVLMKAQEEARIWNWIADAAKREQTLLEALEIAKKSMTDHLLDNRDRGSSTCPWHNAQCDMIREVKSGFVRYGTTVL